MKHSFTLHNWPLFTAALLVAACGGDSPSAPRGRPLSITVVAGATLTDSVQARPAQAVVVEVRDSSGALARGRVIRFDALPPDDPKRRTEAAISFAPLTSVAYGAFATDISDSLGHAKVLIAFGTVSGTVHGRVSVPEFGIADTISFVVLPGAPTKMLIVTRDTTVQPGATYALNASVTDRLSNVVPTEALTYAPGPGIVSVSSAGQVTVGPNIARARITLSWHALIDSANVSIMPTLALVGVRAAPTGRAVTLVASDGSGATDLAISQDQSLAPSASKTTGNVVYYQGDPYSNSSVMIVSAGTSAKPLIGPPTFIAAAWPRMSPDGAWVYFIGHRTGGFGLWRIRVDGTQLDSLAGAASPYVIAPPSISPDGATAILDDVGGLKVVTIATKASRIIPGVGCTGPRHSPDGTRLVCVRAGNLTVMNVDGTNSRSLSQLGALGQFDELSPGDWTSDGAWVLARGGNKTQLVNVTTAATIPLPAFTGTYFQMSLVR